MNKGSSLLIFIITGLLFFLSCVKKIESPIAKAGADQVITLPTDSILLDGSASNDPDGTISVWLWTKISGPSSFQIANPSIARTVVKNLDTGVYRFELKVIDDENLSATDTMQVTVTASRPANQPPVAVAGGDQTITLPTNTITLNGSASTDPDNNIASYVWTKISGPSSFNMSNANAVQAQVINLVTGAYQFELKVTDAGGLFSKDTMQVTVNDQVSTVACDDRNRPTINAQLIPIGTLSQAREFMAVASAGNKILFAGGRTSPYVSSSRVDMFDITTQSWSTAELCTGRYDIAAIASGNKIFFGGGFHRPNGTDYEVDSVDIYDVAVNTWSVTHLSKKGSEIGAAAVANKVFFAGGWGVGRGNLVDIYDLTTQSWATVFLSDSRSEISSVTANGKVYFAGGLQQDSMGISSRIDIYDDATNSWSTSTLNERRTNLAGLEVGNKIYWAGGNNGGNSPGLCSVEINDLITGSSSIQYLFSPAYWINNFGQNAVVKDNRIVFLKHNGGPDANKFDIYDTQTNTWSIGVLPQPIPEGASVVSKNNTIYIAGGSVNGGYSNQVWKLQF